MRTLLALGPTRARKSTGWPMPGLLFVVSTVMRDAAGAGGALAADDGGGGAAAMAFAGGVTALSGGTALCEGSPGSSGARSALGASGTESGAFGPAPRLSVTGARPLSATSGKWLDRTPNLQATTASATVPTPATRPSKAAAAPRRACCAPGRDGIGKFATGDISSPAIVASTDESGLPGGETRDARITGGEVSASNEEDRGATEGAAGATDGGWTAVAATRVRPGACRSSIVWSTRAGASGEAAAEGRLAGGAATGGSTSLVANWGGATHLVVAIPGGTAVGSAISVRVCTRPAGSGAAAASSEEGGAGVSKAVTAPMRAGGLRIELELPRALHRRHLHRARVRAARPPEHRRTREDVLRGQAAR